MGTASRGSLDCATTNILTLTQARVKVGKSTGTLATRSPVATCAISMSWSSLPEASSSPSNEKDSVRTGQSSLGGGRRGWLVWRRGWNWSHLITCTLCFAILLGYPFCVFCSLHEAVRHLITVLHSTQSSAKVSWTPAAERSPHTHAM